MLFENGPREELRREESPPPPPPIIGSDQYIAGTPVQEDGVDAIVSVLGDFGSGVESTPSCAGSLGLDIRGTDASKAFSPVCLGVTGGGVTVPALHASNVE